MTKRQPRFCLPLGALAAAALVVTGCNGETYVRDGVTDGDTFYLAERALTNDDPVLQSWVSYSLTRSACQLKAGGDNPARANSFECELTARRHLVDTWANQRALDPPARDDYLDDLARVDEAGFLPEYVAEHFASRHWRMPAGLDERGYDEWRRGNLPRHRPVTRLIGSWNYSRNVNR